MSDYLKIEKLKAKAEELNNRDVSIGLTSDWQPVEGMYWYDEIVQQNQNDAIKLQESGIPIKLFINTKTGEYKSFHTIIFQ